MPLCCTCSKAGILPTVSKHIPDIGGSGLLNLKLLANSAGPFLHCSPAPRFTDSQKTHHHSSIILRRVFSNVLKRRQSTWDKGFNEVGFQIQSVLFSKSCQSYGVSWSDMRSRILAAFSAVVILLHLSWGVNYIHHNLVPVNGKNNTWFNVKQSEGSHSRLIKARQSRRHDLFIDLLQEPEIRWL